VPSQYPVFTRFSGLDVSRIGPYAFLHSVFSEFAGF
jgi:hypothetical protein